MTRRRPTPSQTVGPFFGFALPFAEDAQAVVPASTGVIHIEGRVLDGRGAAVSDALLEAWSEDQFARCRTDPEGAYAFWLRAPIAPHIELTVFARGLLRHLMTRIYLPGAEAARAADPVFRKVPVARRQTLIAHREPGGTLRFDVRLQGPGETVFFAF
jgi:protocatechuate 3,4-dioxygenase alpha subunit